MKTILLLLFSNVYLVDGLSKFVDSYQTLSYPPVSGRAKRSIDGSTLPIKLQFASHNRTFRLLLKHIDDDFSAFARDLEVFADGVPVHINPRNFLVHGYDQSDKNSKIYGSVLDGIFDGHIHYSNGESYTVDKVGRHLSLGDRPLDFHSIIYSDDAINHPKFRRKRSVDNEADRTCGLTEEVKQYMDRIQRSAIVDDEAAVTKKVPEAYSVNASFDSYFNSFARKKRNLDELVSSIHGKQVYNVRSCYMYFQADHKLYEHIYEREGNKNHLRTKEEILNLFYSHIKAVNQIYTDTDFNGIRGINFVIQRVSVFSPETCESGKSKSDGGKNPFCDENVDVSNYLNLNSKINHSDFCLAYAVTYRDFIGGTLGLAWVASPNHNTAGGICQQYTKYPEQATIVQRSLNTGIITLVNYGNRVPTRVSQLTLAHEIGHNFGSPHDFPPECQPGLPDGNFIMFASATSGDKKNNAQFSKCSIANISLVLMEVLQQPPLTSDRYRSVGLGGPAKRNCFRESMEAFCGNGIKEPKEECDCGYTQEDCNQMQDVCCYPHDSGQGCKRKGNAQCSPSEGKCCNIRTCSFDPANAFKQCRAESECLQEQHCNGTSAECPQSQPKPDGTRCQEATKVCNAGSCNGSVCATVGLKDCFLTTGSADRLCHLACEDRNGTCKSTLELPQFAAGKYNQTGREGLAGLILLPGSPCNNYKGYCDIFRKCRSVDADGPLARLKNVIFNPKTFEGVKSWIQLNWWAVVLGGLGLMLFMAIFIKCCAVHTPSTNPNKAPALSIYETLRRPKTLIYGQRNSRSTSQHAHSRAPAARRQHGHRSNGERSQAAALHSVAPPSAPPIPQVQIPTNVVVVEPPPPYSAATDPGTALGGPKRGHRKKRKEDVELRVKNRRS